MFARLARFSVPMLCVNSGYPSAGRLSHDFIDDGQTLKIHVEFILFHVFEPEIS